MSDTRRDLAMSLATQLGLDDPDRGHLAQARMRWRSWQQEHPELRVCSELLDLPAWTRTADDRDKNEALLALAQLGAVDGKDDPSATAALIWLLLPGAVEVTQTLTPMRERMDELVAAQLWISARTVNWKGRVRVAKTVLMNTRRDLLRELRRGQNPREELGLPDILVAPDQAGMSSTASDYLYDLLEEAVGRGVVDRDDTHVLLRLADVADTGRTGRGKAGLTGAVGLAAVAAELGVSGPTVYRRATRALSKLQESYRVLSA